MESKTGYFIDIVNGKVETAEEHDAKVRADERAKTLDEFVNWMKEKGIHGSKEYTRVIRMYEDELKEQKNE